MIHEHDDGAGRIPQPHEQTQVTAPPIWMRDDSKAGPPDVISYELALSKATTLRRHMEALSVECVDYMRLLDRDWSLMMFHDQLDELSALIETLTPLAATAPDELLPRKESAKG